MKDKKIFILYYRFLTDARDGIISHIERVSELPDKTDELTIKVLKANGITRGLTGKGFDKSKGIIMVIVDTFHPRWDSIRDDRGKMAAIKTIKKHIILNNFIDNLN